MDANIFHYHDGIGDRCADPFRIERILHKYMGGDPKKVTQSAVSEIPDESIAATDQMLLAISKAFEITIFDPITRQGMTEDFLLKTYDAFLDFREKKNLTIATSPTLPPSTGFTPYPDQSSPIPTNSCTACG